MAGIGSCKDEIQDVWFEQLPKPLPRMREPIRFLHRSTTSMPLTVLTSGETESPRSTNRQKLISWLAGGDSSRGQRAERMANKVATHITSGESSALQLRRRLSSRLEN